MSGPGNEERVEEEANIDGAEEDLLFFSKAIKHTLCLVKCKRARMPEDR